MSLRSPVVVLFYFAYAAVYVGWLTHRSSYPAVLGYSPAYAAFLLVMFWAGYL